MSTCHTSGAKSGTGSAAHFVLLIDLSVGGLRLIALIMRQSLINLGSIVNGCIRPNLGSHFPPHHGHTCVPPLVLQDALLPRTGSHRMHSKVPGSLLHEGMTNISSQFKLKHTACDFQA